MSFPIITRRYAQEFPSFSSKWTNETRPILAAIEESMFLNSHDNNCSQTLLHFDKVFSILETYRNTEKLKSESLTKFYREMFRLRDQLSSYSYNGLTPINEQNYGIGEFEKAYTNFFNFMDKVISPGLKIGKDDQLIDLENQVRRIFPYRPDLWNDQTKCIIAPRLIGPGIDGSNTGNLNNHKEISGIVTSSEFRNKLMDLIGDFIFNEYFPLNIRSGCPLPNHMHIGIIISFNPNEYTIQTHIQRDSFERSTVSTQLAHVPDSEIVEIEEASGLKLVWNNLVELNLNPRLERFLGDQGLIEKLCEEFNDQDNGGGLLIPIIISRDSLIERSMRVQDEDSRLSN